MFNLFGKEISNIDKEFNLELMKNKAVYECSLLDIAITLEKSELQLLKEETTDDTSAIYEEASTGVINAFKKKVETIIEILKRFFANIKDKIISMITKEKNTQMLEKLKEKASDDKFKNVKVEIPDGDARSKFLDKFTAIYASMLNKIKNGAKVTKDEVMSVRDKFKAEHPKAYKATKVILIADAISWASFFVLKATGQWDNLQNKMMKTYLNYTLPDNTDPEILKCAQSIMDDMTKMNKMGADAWLNEYIESMNSINNKMHD